MCAIRLIKDNKGHLHPFLLPTALYLVYAFATFGAFQRLGAERVKAGVASSAEAWVISIAVSTFPIWGAVLFGAAAVLVTRGKRLYFTDYAIEAFGWILGGVIALVILGALTAWVISLL